MEKTIATISTPLGKGAISIVRMSGEKSLEIATKLFYTKGKIEPRRMVLGRFKIEENMFENCLMVYFKAPYSYTGEDLIEFQIHGGILITQKILEKILENGAILAEPGEFTKRAFLNGKIGLDEAEAIAEVINSESESELKANLSLAGGLLFNKIKELQNGLTETLAKIEVTLDYPEEDVDETVREDIYKEVNTVKDEVSTLLKNSDSAKYVKNGINVAIIGRTNVGKSSLLNALLGENKAIVTNIEGTTRDIIEGSYFYKGIKINLIDTAGIRNTLDEVEKIGVERSKEEVSKADIILFVLDGSQKISSEDKEILNLSNKTPYICVINKSDLGRKIEKLENEIVISAKENKNIDLLKEEIFNKVIKEEVNFNEVILTNERQNYILKDCLDIIKEIENAKEQPLEVITLLIKKLWMTLGKITGNTENEDIIDLIFSKFCLGK